MAMFSSVWDVAKEAEIDSEIELSPEDGIHPAS